MLIQIFRQISEFQFFFQLIFDYNSCNYKIHYHFIAINIQVYSRRMMSGRASHLPLLLRQEAKWLKIQYSRTVSPPRCCFKLRRTATIITPAIDALCTWPNDITWKPLRTVELSSHNLIFSSSISESFAALAPTSHYGIRHICREKFVPFFVINQNNIYCFIVKSL